MPKYRVILQPSAIEDLDSLRKYDAKMIADGIEEHLEDAPDKVSKSRIKELRGEQRTDYRLRVGDFRAFYDIDKEEHIVYVLRVMHKDETKEFYEEV